MKKLIVLQVCLLLVLGLAIHWVQQMEEARKMLVPVSLSADLKIPADRRYYLDEGRSVEIKPTRFPVDPGVDWLKLPEEHWRGGKPFYVCYGKPSYCRDIKVKPE